MHNTLSVPDAQGVRFIAHRGVSGIETENTCPAFTAAGCRSYFGIETDVHRTADGEFVIFHDDSAKRVAGVDTVIEQTPFAALRDMPLHPVRFYKPVGAASRDRQIPTLSEYIDICRHYDKTAVLELKNHFEKADVFRICDIIEAAGWLSRVIFISFDFDNLVTVRERCPENTVQFLSTFVDDEIIDRLRQHHFDLDVYYIGLTAQKVKKCHDAGILVNCWTVDEPAPAARLIRCGVDYITTDILE